MMIAPKMADRKRITPPYIMITGPTASGKSRLAVELAKQIDGAVINADSMQLYTDLRVLTARPDSENMQNVPHYLYGIIDGAHRASVGEWLIHSAAAMLEIRQAGKIPIIVGGTGMYLQAGLRGIAPMPDIPQTVQQHCISLHKKLGPKNFRLALAELDPNIAERLVDGDTQRLIRAMGVSIATGRPLSWWQQQPHKGAFLGDVKKIAIMPKRAELYERINKRFDKMFTEGAVDEVRSLMARHLDPSLPLMKALGVSPLRAFLEGKISANDAKSIAKRDSRRYAKRQMTWIRNNYIEEILLEKKLSESLLEKIFSLIH